MRSISWYIKEARKRSGASSERKMCEVLEIAPNSITNYTRKNVLPSDDTMMKLAKMAGVDPFIGLLDLNMWRTEGDAKTAYKKILEKISLGAFVLALCIYSTPSNASHFNQMLKPSTSSITEVYIITQKVCRKVIQFLKLFCNPLYELTFISPAIFRMAKG